MTDQPSNPTAAALAAIALAVGLGLAFFYAYAGGLHKPKPHAVPFAVIAPKAEYSEIANKLEAHDALAPRRVADTAIAIEQLKQRKIYGAIALPAPAEPAATEPAAPAKPARLYLATAGSAVAAELIEDAATEVAQKSGMQLTTTDVAPLPARDPEGLVSFYLVIAAVLGGYIAVALSIGAGAATRLPFRAALRHLGVFAGFAIAFGILVMVIADPLMNAVSGNFWALAGIEALIFATAAAVALGLFAAFGRVAGFLCAIVLLILLGNSSSGGASPGDFLPGFWRALNDVLPNAAGVNATTDIAYFPDVSLERPLLTLVAWLVGGALVYLVLRPREAGTDTQAT